MSKISTFACRLRELLEIKGITKAELSRITGINKSSLTHYVKGDWEGKQDAVYAIATAMGVNEAWIMGYDVPMLRGLTVCPVCGLQYDSSLPSDNREHERVHSQFLEAKERYGFFYQPNDWQRIKSASWDALYSDATTENKCDAAINLMKVYFCRSVSANSFSHQHPLFPKYAAMLLNQKYFRQKFGESAYTVLVAKYGTAPGIPERQTTYQIQRLLTKVTPISHKEGKIAPVVTEAEKLAKDFQKLDGWGKKLVRTVVNNELARCNAARRRQMHTSAEVIGDAASTVIPFRRSYQPASAGTGIYLGPDEFETIYVQENDLTSRASFGVPVSGDSMEPDYHDGDVLLVERAEDIRVGEIGVFTIDGDGFVKKLGDGELISLNPAYAPIPMNENIWCNGRVIGVLAPEWIVEK